MTNPNKLYHYTSVETLELILESKKIKFNRLDKVNDKNEGESKDFGQVGMFFFLSCWTAEPEENIPLWSIYSGGMEGVRIELPSDMFQRHEVHSNPERNFIAAKGASSYLSQKDLHGEDYFANSIPVDFLKKVDYTNDKDMYTPELFNGVNVLSLGKVGEFKRKEWEYEKEWRFIFSVTSTKNINMNSDNGNKTKFESHFGDRTLSREEFYLDINDQALKKMEIMDGPKISEEKAKLVKELIARFNPKAKYVNSSLKGEIR